MSSTKRKAVAVELEHGRGIIPIDQLSSIDAKAYSVQRVIWEDGTSSWGASWTIWTGTKHVFTRVGAGAYGDSVVWARETKGLNYVVDGQLIPMIRYR